MTALEALIREEIHHHGPISLARYWTLALAHPVHGYYRKQDPLGAAGDFVTAPEISQMFGELIGLWIAATAEMQGLRAPLRLVELGPGRGTLMADALRALRAVPAFRDGLTVDLVETSPALRKAQEAALAASGATLRWHEHIGALPPGPAFTIANEFLDALPVRQYLRVEGGFAERLIGLVEAEDGPRLGFSASSVVLPLDSFAEPFRRAAIGSIVEISEPRERVVTEVAARIAETGGAALFIDYGHALSAAGDTFQAMRAHGFADPFAAPGDADLTTQVDFEPLLRAARVGGALGFGPVTQRDFLLGLGIETRARRLIAGTPSARGSIEAALARLTDPAPTGMGALFKVMAVLPKGAPPPPGFAP